MEFSIKFDILKSGWSIVYIEGSQVIISNRYCISFPEGRFWFSKQCRHNVAFHLGLHCLPKYPFRGFWYTKS